MSLAVAPSPLALRGLMYPGFTHKHVLARQHLYCWPDNTYVFQVSITPLLYDIIHNLSLCVFY